MAVRLIMDSALQDLIKRLHDPLSAPVHLDTHARLTHATRTRSACESTDPAPDFIPNRGVVQSRPDTVGCTVEGQHERYRRDEGMKHEPEGGNDQEMSRMT